MTVGYSNMDFLRLATTLSGLSKGYVRTSWNLPDPVLPIYNESTIRANRADGGQGLRGQRSVVLVWNDLGPIDAWTLRKIVNDAIDVDGTFYATVNLNWVVAGAPNHWIDVNGIVILPTSQLADNTEGAIQSQFTLTINRVVVVNDPASF